MTMAQSDHDRLIRIDENVAMLLERQNKSDDVQKEQDKRIGKLENFQAKLIGIAGAVSFIVSVIWAQFGRLFGIGA